MASVPVALLTRPPTREELDAPATAAPVVDGLPPLDPNAFEVVVDTDKLLVACSCRSSSDQPY